jgi:hypothetical protein
MRDLPLSDQSFATHASGQTGLFLEIGANTWELESRVQYSYSRLVLESSIRFMHATPMRICRILALDSDFSKGTNSIDLRGLDEYLSGKQRFQRFQ